VRTESRNPLTVLIRGETAGALGQAGRRLKRATDALLAFDAGDGTNGRRSRESLVREASAALYAYVVQKELLGAADRNLVTQVYGVTPEIWKSLGVMPREATPRERDGDSRRES
jgi:hypothetical protein